MGKSGCPGGWQVVAGSEILTPSVTGRSWLVICFLGKFDGPFPSLTARVRKKSGCVKEMNKYSLFSQKQLGTIEKSYIKRYVSARKIPPIHQEAVMKKKGSPWLLLIVLWTNSWFLYSQESLTSFYNYPFSVGAGYQMLSPVAGVDRAANIVDLSAKVRVPLPGLPLLQPFAVLGLTSFDSEEGAAPIILGGSLNEGASEPSYDPRDTWDHQTVSFSLGMGYAQRLSREFELGAELSLGLEQSFFPQRVITAEGEWYPVGELGLAAGLSGKLSLNPSYNISIDITPAFRYRRSLGNLPDFDGLYFGLGFGGHYRFGEDPDSPRNDTRAIQFISSGVPEVFAAMQKVYIHTPITTVTLKNIEKNAVTNLEVSFNQAGYMDAPTLCAEIDFLEPGDSVEVPLLAGFNERVFTTIDVVPLSGEITVTYGYRGRTITQTRSVGMNLHDRNALIWDDDRKVAAFMTPKDSAVRNYASFVADRAREDRTDYLPKNLELAMQAYHALGALDMGYQSDPSSPFSEVKGGALALDTVSLPRETLMRGTGDCDDLTVLYNTMLESLNVPTGFVTIPGHIYSAVDTGLAPREYGRIHPDRNMTLVFQETLWILVEGTLVGRTDFLTAWKTGMEQWNRYSGDETVRALYSTRKSQEIYQPVGLQESDIGLQYGSADRFLAAFRKDRDALAAAILGSLKARVDQRETPQGWNLYGAAAARLGQYTAAENAFTRASRLDRTYLSPLVNLGSLKYLKKDYPGALTAFQSALKLIDPVPEGDPRAASVLLNISLVLEAMDRSDEARSYVARAREADPQTVAQIQTTNPGTEGRASSGELPSILFLSEAAE
jgi:tetratricopeptide (TPR) repeat protein